MSKDSCEEEVPLSGAKPVMSREPEMVAKEGQLTGLIQNATTNAEIVDIISAASSEQLIPWEEAELPSKGFYYGWGSGIIEVKAWGTKVDKILATARLVQSGQAIDKVFSECCRFPDGFDPVDLLVGDQVFLLYYLRGITHGNIYEFFTTCPDKSCQHVSSHSIDLNDLVSTITWADQSLGPEPFKIVLPYFSRQTGREISVSVRFLRVSDAQGIQRQQKAREIAHGSTRVRVKPRDRKMQMQPQMPQELRDSIPIDDTLAQNIETIITDVMGVSDRFKVRAFVDKMHSSDIATVRDWLTENTPGIETMIDLQCPQCNETHRAMLPITESFFRPQNVRAV
jgi:hypothetical protein